MTQDRYVKLINDEKIYRLDEVDTSRPVHTYTLEVPPFAEDKAYITVTANFVEKTFTSEEVKQCALCSKTFHSDNLEECPDCKRLACYDCTFYDREYDTGAELPECCSECYDKRCQADREADTAIDRYYEDYPEPDNDVCPCGSPLSSFSPDGIHCVSCYEGKETRQSSTHIHDTIYNILDTIEEVRETGVSVSVESVKSIVGEESPFPISDTFLDCVIRFEAEIQQIVAKEQ